LSVSACTRIYTYAAKRVQAIADTDTCELKYQVFWRFHDTQIGNLGNQYAVLMSSVINLLLYFSGCVWH